VEAAQLGSSGTVGDVAVGADQVVGGLAGSVEPQAVVGVAVRVDQGAWLGVASQPVHVHKTSVAVAEHRGVVGGPSGGGPGEQEMELGSGERPVKGLGPAVDDDRCIGEPVPGVGAVSQPRVAF
jgi:hypothetical protein